MGRRRKEVVEQITEADDETVQEVIEEEHYHSKSGQTKVVCSKCGIPVVYFGTAKVYDKCSTCRKEL